MFLDLVCGGISLFCIVGWVCLSHALNIHVVFFLFVFGVLSWLASIIGAQFLQC